MSTSQVTHLHQCPDVSMWTTKVFFCNVYVFIPNQIFLLNLNYWRWFWNKSKEGERPEWHSCTYYNRKSETTYTTFKNKYSANMIKPIVHNFGFSLRCHSSLILPGDISWSWWIQALLAGAIGGWLTGRSTWDRLGVLLIGSSRSKV